MDRDKFRRVISNVLNHIADFYLYFLAFYAFSLVLSLFFESWRLFFYWPAFHLSAAIFAVLSLLSEKGRQEISNIKFQISKMQIKNKVFQPADKISKLEIPKIKRPSFNFKIRIPETKVHLLNFADLFFYFINYFIKKFFAAISVLRIAVVLAAAVLAGIFKTLLNFFHWQTKKMKKANFAKVGFIGAVLLFSLFGGINVMNFLVLAYGLISVLFIMESRISVLVALAFLVLAPVFLIIESSSFAEKMAIFAYYFLIIAVATQIREYFREQGLTRQNFKEI